MDKITKRLQQNIDSGLLETLIFDWIFKQIPDIAGESKEEREDRALTYIAYIEKEVKELGADFGLLLIFELRAWIDDNAPFYLSLEKYKKIKHAGEAFISEHGVLLFEN